MCLTISRRLVAAAVMALIAGTLLATNCTAAKKPAKKAPKEAKMAWTLKSNSITEGKRIPDKFTCKGIDVSPELSWDPAPKGTQEIALIMDDPDAPVGTWTHWTVYGISPEKTSFPENVEKTLEAKSIGALHGITSYGKSKPGYYGPCPPPGKVHHYHFKLYALDKKTGLPAGASLAQLEAAIKGHTIAEAKLMGTYSREK
jgi:Raf kinase inhibitor-like YbhB/YbcL family protein